MATYREASAVIASVAALAAESNDDVSPTADEAEFRLGNQVSESGQDVRWCTMGTYIGQTSHFQPAVVLDIYKRAELP